MVDTFRIYMHSVQQLMNNEEITNVVKILGLHYTKKYSEIAELRSLRYGRLLIMTDQDQDGSHIKGLVINFLHHNWPSLLRHNFVQEFITPIVKVAYMAGAVFMQLATCIHVCVTHALLQVSKGNREHSFFSLPEFEQWRCMTEGAHTWKVKYYKGLGTSTSKEAKEYFSDMERHRIPFKYIGPEDDDAILLVSFWIIVQRLLDSSTVFSLTPFLSSPFLSSLPLPIYLSPFLTPSHPLLSLPPYSHISIHPLFLHSRRSVRSVLSVVRSGSLSGCSIAGSNGIRATMSRSSTQNGWSTSPTLTLSTKNSSSFPTWTMNGPLPALWMVRC